MNAITITADDTRNWSFAGGLALALHLCAAVLLLLWANPIQLPIIEPTILIELPPLTDMPATPAAAPQSASEKQPTPLPTQPAIAQKTPSTPPVAQSVNVTPAQATPSPIAAATPPISTPVAAAQSFAPVVTQASDPRAKKQEADYFSLISAHLNRKKTYPAEAKQARQQGIVTVRFTIDRNGGISNTSIKRSSGHALLDEATLALLLRVAPLPRMPASMQHDSVTIALPIEYSLRTI